MLLCFRVGNHFFDPCLPLALSLIVLPALLIRRPFMEADCLVYWKVLFCYILELKTQKTCSITESGELLAPYPNFSSKSTASKESKLLNSWFSQCSRLSTNAKNTFSYINSKSTRIQSSLGSRKLSLSLCYWKTPFQPTKW